MEPELRETAVTTKETGEQTEAINPKRHDSDDYLLNTAFEGKSGKLYIQQWQDKNRFTIRESIEAYNQRTGTIDFTDKETAMKDFKQWKAICKKTATIDWF